MTRSVSLFFASLLAAVLAAGCNVAATGRRPDAAASPVTDAPASPPEDDAGAASAEDAGTVPPDEADAGGPPDEADAGEPVPTEHPMDLLDDVDLAIIVGDSVAAGYDATGRNDTNGHGFARQVVDSHPSVPAYAGHDLRTLFPGIDFRRVAESGATSGDALANLRGASLPTVSGDVVAILNVGGNDVNDSVLTLIDRTRATAVATELRANLREMFSILRGRYDHPERGQSLVVLVDDLYDPTDGTGRIPATFRDGFCSTLQNPLLTDGIRAMALANLALVNDAIAAEVAAQGGVLVRQSVAFVGHGMNAAGSERWLSNDCTHPFDVGHDGMRRAIWEALTGERF